MCTNNQNNYKLAKECATLDIEEEVSNENYRKLHSNHEGVTMLNFKSPEVRDTPDKTQGPGWDGYIEECYAQRSKKKIVT